MSEPVNSDHRRTLERLFGHASENIEWRQVRSLLEALGAVSEEHNGKLKVTLGDETEILHPPHGKDVDPQMIVDLRRMLRRAGLAPAGPNPTGADRASAADPAIRRDPRPCVTKLDVQRIMTSEPVLEADEVPEMDDEPGDPGDEAAQPQPLMSATAAPRPIVARLPLSR